MFLSHVPKKPWISEPTLNIIEDQRAAGLRGDKPEVKRLTRERNRALGLDQGRNWDAKAAAIESAVARQDQHTVFRELRTCKLGLNNQSTTVQAEDGTRLTNIKDCLCRWKDHFNDLLKLKLTFRQYPAIHTNYIISHCTTLQYDHNI